MIVLKRFYQRKRPPQVKTAKKRSAIRRHIIENLQQANITKKQAGAEAEQIMAELLQQCREGKLSKSENAMLKYMIMLEKIVLEKIPNELEKFEELTISDYKEHCTIDGINGLFAAKSHLERCVWIIAIIACFVLAGVLCLKNIDEWYEIETKTHYFPIENLNYPDVIICPDLIYNQDQLAEYIREAINSHITLNDSSLMKFLNTLPKMIAKSPIRRTSGNEIDFLKTMIQLNEDNGTDYNNFMEIGSILLSTMMNQDEYPHIHLPLLSRNTGEMFKLMDEKNSSEFITKMLDISQKNDEDQKYIWMFKIVNIVWNLRCEQDVIRKQKQLACTIANFAKNIDPMKISYNCTYFLLYYYPSMYWDDVDEILGLNLTNRDILSKYEGIMNFCPEFVKEDFDFRHKCYRFNSEEIFPYPNKSSIGIVFPNDVEHDLFGEKGFWFSIVDKTKEGKNDDNTSSIYNSLDWVYLRPGVHTVSIDATRNLILRSSAESRCSNPDIISNYNYNQCIKQTCDSINKKTKWDCILPIKTSSKVDNKYKMCMEMPNDIETYYDANKYLHINESELQNRFYIRLLYKQNIYGLSEQFYKITNIQFLSNIGGTTGVCIGISLMSICQILLYTTMVIVGRVKRNRRERNSQKVGNHDNDNS